MTNQEFWGWLVTQTRTKIVMRVNLVFKDNLFLPEDLLGSETYLYTQRASDSQLFSLCVRTTHEHGITDVSEEHCYKTTAEMDFNQWRKKRLESWLECREFIFCGSADTIVVDAPRYRKFLALQELARVGTWLACKETLTFQGILLLRLEGFLRQENRQLLRAMENAVGSLMKV